MRRFLVPQVYAEPGAAVPAVCLPKSADSILTLSFPAAILAAKKRRIQWLTTARKHKSAPNNPAGGPVKRSRSCEGNTSDPLHRIDGAAGFVLPVRAAESIIMGRSTRIGGTV